MWERVARLVGGRGRVDVGESVRVGGGGCEGWCRRVRVGELGKREPGRADKGCGCVSARV